VPVLHGWALDSKVWLDTRALIDHTRFTYAYFDFPGYGSNRSAPLADGMEGMAASALTPVSPQGTPLDEASYESFKSAWADPGPVLRSLAPHLH